MSSLSFLRICHCEERSHNTEGDYRYHISCAGFLFELLTPTFENEARNYSIRRLNDDFSSRLDDKRGFYGFITKKEQTYDKQSQNSSLSGRFMLAKNRQSWARPERGWVTCISTVIWPAGLILCSFNRMQYSPASSGHAWTLSISMHIEQFWRHLIVSRMRTRRSTNNITFLSLWVMYIYYAGR